MLGSAIAIIVAPPPYRSNITPMSSYPQKLRSLLQSAHLPSLKALSRTANVSEWQVKQLGKGQAAKMRVEPLHKLSQALQVSLPELISQFSDLTLASYDLQPEYQRLQTQLQQQQETLQQEFQQASLQILESWLVQYPTAAYAAQQNPEVPALRLIPLMRPVEQLVKSWGLEAIAPVGTELPYDPQIHQLMDGEAEVGDRVKVRYTGYRQGEKLLYRAKVSPIKAPTN
jgi:molecular chaperone GrpE (heat shock protein)